jgi:myo-inositol-1(or 4)-monophosphatase
LEERISVRLIDIAGDIAKKFDYLEYRNQEQVKYIKHDNLRDVVIDLDIEIHNLLSNFCATHYPKTFFLSEESTDSSYSWKKIVNSDSIMVVDPLDGSNNVVCGIQEFGFMACVVERAKFVESLVVLPNENQIISWSKDFGVVSSRKILIRKNPSASTYLAYSPQLSKELIESRLAIMSLLDGASAGVYRYGSACLGLFRTLTGAHSTFIGLEMRPWDVISFFPILASSGANIAYHASDTDISVCISYDHDLFLKGKKLLSEINGDFQDFYLPDALAMMR